jgi:hypothetical protein
VFDHAIFGFLREMATPSEIFWPRGAGGAPAPAFRTHISWSRDRVVRMSVKVRAPMRRKSPLGRYCTRRKPAWTKWPVSRRVILVARSISKASPKLFDMKAMRRSSGDQDARSPKPVSRVTFAGSCSSGFPLFFGSAETSGARKAAASAIRGAAFKGDPGTRS